MNTSIIAIVTWLTIILCTVWLIYFSVFSIKAFICWLNKERGSISLIVITVWLYVVRLELRPQLYLFSIHRWYYFGLNWIFIHRSLKIVFFYIVIIFYLGVSSSLITRKSVYSDIRDHILCFKYLRLMVGVIIGLLYSHIV
jgi:hypothetical protein